MDIDWKKYVDRIFCIFHLPNMSRMSRIKDELSRVGILQSGIFEWRFTTPSRYDEVIQKSFSDKKWITNIGYVNEGLELLRIFKESNLFGYKKILILEDDVAFLKDLNKLEKIISQIPDGFDVVQLDKGFGDERKVREWNSVKENKINESFIDVGKHCFGLATANVYNIQGIRKAIRKFESKPIAADQINREGEFKWATADANACIQILFGTSNSNSAISCHYMYTSAGIDYSMYNVPNGYSSKTLFNPRSEKQMIEPMTQKTLDITTKSRWDCFDYIGVVCYTGYKDRVEELLPELERVGLKGKAHLHWDVPSAFRDKLFDAVGKTKFCSRPGCFNMTVAHYTIVKTAYELGCNNVLVMEDDMRFLKDVNAIDSLLYSIPLDYDHIMLDRNRLCTTDLKVFSSIPEGVGRYKWIEFEESGSTGCYAMSRKGMSNYIRLIEEDIKIGNVHNPDHYFRRSLNGRTYWDYSYKRYFCYPNLAVQSIAGKNGSFSNLVDYWRNLSPAGIRPEDYNISIRVVTKDSFNSLLDYAIEKKESGTKKGLAFCKDNSQIIKCHDKNLCNEINTGKCYLRSILWGMRAEGCNLEALQVALRDNAQINIAEHGLISRVTPRESLTDKFGQAHSFVLDNHTAYFDSRHISDLERMLNDISLVINIEERVKAKRLISRIVENKISRYNHMSLDMKKIGRNGVRKILVVDQTFDDLSITMGMASETTFKRMLDMAIKENPDCDIIIKTHPCVISGIKTYKNGYYNTVTEKDNIYKVTTPINPYSLMEFCDKVYVVTSTLGFEALMAGKEVHVFGMPFYAGWGLTIDDQHLDRRTNMRTLEELFYIFYCMYTHWVDPDKGCETTIDAVIDKMIALREEYNKKPNMRQYSQKQNSISDDGFGYQLPHVRKQDGFGIANPVITNRKPITVLPRIRP